MLLCQLQRQWILGLVTSLILLAPLIAEACNESCPPEVCHPFHSNEPVLSISKSGPSSVQAGDTFTYTIRVARVTHSDLTKRVDIVDTLPANLTFVSAHVEPSTFNGYPLTQNRCTFDGQTVRCSASTGPLDPFQSVTVTITVRASVSCAILRNQATVRTYGVIASINGLGYSPTMTTNMITTLVGGACTPPNLTIAKTGSASIVMGQTIVYAVTVTNSGQTAADNVVVTDPVPTGMTFTAAASDSSCSLQGNNVTCALGTVPRESSRTIKIAFMVNVPTICMGAITLQNQASVSTSTTESNTSDNTSTIVTTRADCPPGCIDIVKEAFDGAGQPVAPPIPPFTFRLDGNATTVNGSNGRAHFGNLAYGTHTVAEIPLSGWTPMSVTPANGTVNVGFGPQCAVVTFKNQQIVNPTVTSSSSAPSSSSASSAVALGCITVLKETFDAQGYQITPVTPFTFQLDGSATAQNGGNGLLTFANVPLGTHTVTEMSASGWNQFNVTPALGRVIVNQGLQCAVVTFKNQQIQVATASSSSASFSSVSSVPSSSSSASSLSSSVSSMFSSSSSSSSTTSVPSFFPPASTYTAFAVPFSTYQQYPQPVTYSPLVAYNSIVTARCSLSVEKTADRSEAQVGDMVRYTVTVRNIGGQTANGVTVTDTPDVCAVVVDPGGGAVNGNGVRWEIGSLGGGQSRSFGYSVRLMPSSAQRVSNVVRAESSNCGGTQAVAVVGIIRELPQTGGMGGIAGGSVEHLRKMGGVKSGELKVESGKWGWVLMLGMLGVGAGVGGVMVQRKRF